ncbi:MAG: hypothetical protein ABW043_16755 [Devosia sp.]|uniref:hypothetical protein n=1 Tax=Devosia sp. TaxID=1871048 RepID=UPI003390CA8B
MWLLINADNSLAGTSEESPVPGQGQRAIVAPVGYGETSEWTSEHGGGFKDIVPPAPTKAENLIEALLTCLEEAEVITAAQADEIRAFAD